LLKAITSASGEVVHRLSRVWIYGNTPQAGGDEFPFLFIDGGVATLSGSALGIAIIRDAITRREIQLLEHTGIYRLFFSKHFLTLVLAIAGRRVSAIVIPVPLEDGDMLTTSLSAKAYHVSNSKYSIVTADRGADATIKIWTAQRPSSYPRAQVGDSFYQQRFEPLSN